MQELPVCLADPLLVRSILSPHNALIVDPPESACPAGGPGGRWRRRGRREVRLGLPLDFPLLRSLVWRPTGPFCLLSIWIQRTAFKVDFCEVVGTKVRTCSKDQSLEAILDRFLQVPRILRSEGGILLNHSCIWRSTVV